MQLRQAIVLGFVLVVSGCSTPTPQAGFDNTIEPGRAVKWMGAGGTLTAIYSFQGKPDGAVPQGAVSVYHGCARICNAVVIGNTTAGGTENAGTIYLVSTPDLTTGGHWTERVLLDYSPSGTGSDPMGSLTAPKGYGGPIFGTASQGGSHGKGTVVEIKGTTNTVLSFNGRDGAFPAGGLLHLQLGHTNLVATSAGGSHNLGAIVSVTRYKRLRPNVLYSFSGQSDGEHPNSEITGCYSCVHYGTTAGSTSVPATVYGFTSGHGLTTLHTFTSSSDGETPTGVIPYEYGSSKKVTLFGTTLQGGSAGYGTLYVLKPQGSTYKKVTLHTFAGGTSDGAYPYGPPIITEGANPDLYLVTASGGKGGCGTIVSYDLSSAKYALLYSFTCGADGAYPEAPIISDVTYGNLYYGTTSAGGTANDGVVFTFEPR